MPDAVKVDGVFQIRGGQELGLTDLAGPGAVHVGRIHIAAIDDLQGRDHLRTKLVGPAAVKGERGQRADGGKLARIGAEIGLQSPDGDDHRPRYAVLLLDTRKNRCILLEELRCLGKPRRNHAVGKLLESLPEHALCVVARDDVRVKGDAAERRLDGALGYPLRGRLGLEALEPGVEVAAAGRGRRGRHDHAGEPKSKQCQPDGLRSHQLSFLAFVPTPCSTPIGVMMRQVAGTFHKLRRPEWAGER